MKIVVNESPFDQFTFVHGAAGVLARCTGISFGMTLALGFVWDYWLEPKLKTSHPNLFPFPSPDAPSHAFVDAVTPAVTWVLYDEYLKKGKK